MLLEEIATVVVLVRVVVFGNEDNISLAALTWYLIVDYWRVKILVK